MSGKVSDIPIRFGVTGTGPGLGASFGVQRASPVRSDCNPRDLRARQLGAVRIASQNRRQIFPISTPPEQMSRLFFLPHLTSSDVGVRDGSRLRSQLNPQQADIDRNATPHIRHHGLLSELRTAKGWSARASFFSQIPRSRPCNCSRGPSKTRSGQRIDAFQMRNHAKTSRRADLKRSAKTLSHSSWRTAGQDTSAARAPTLSGVSGARRDALGSQALHDKLASDA